MENISGDRIKIQNARENTTEIKVRLCSGVQKPRHEHKVGNDWLAARLWGLASGKCT